MTPEIPSGFAIITTNGREAAPRPRAREDAPISTEAGSRALSAGTSRYTPQGKGKFPCHLSRSFTNDSTRPYTKPDNKGKTSSRKAARRVVDKPGAVDEVYAREQILERAKYLTKREESPSSESDVDIMYSYDAPAGPIAGECVLNSALDQAVERFENNEFEKIIKEFEIVEDEVESTIDVDDGFELIG